MELKSVLKWLRYYYLKPAQPVDTIGSLSLTRHTTRAVELPNGLDVWWDGQTRAYVDAPADMRGQVSGLCGTFTDNQKDDFLTPEGDVEQNHVAFANKWKTSDVSCCRFSVKSVQFY